jgi:biopolymer transport protein ExbD
MRFPRQTRIFRGQPDAAPFASVFFLLVLFLLLRSGLVFTPGIPLELPESVDLPGADQPTLDVAVDKAGNFYFDNQIVAPPALRDRMRGLAAESDLPLTLVIHAHRDVPYETLIRLASLADAAGIKKALLATRPIASSELAPSKP